MVQIPVTSLNQKSQPGGKSRGWRLFFIRFAENRLAMISQVRCLKTSSAGRASKEACGTPVWC
jgi:hypothetical protein